VLDPSDEKHTLAEDERWRLIESALGSIDDIGHEWDDDPEDWVRAQRHDPLRADNGPADKE
jgi:hypothetical protein